jgi:hypothetical protein
MKEKEAEKKLRLVEMLLIISTVLFGLKPSQNFIFFFLFAIFYYMMIIMDYRVDNRLFPFIAIGTAFFFSLPFGIVSADMAPNITPLYHSFLIISNSIMMTIVLSLVLNEKKIVNSFLIKIIKKFQTKNLTKKKKR